MWISATEVLHSGERVFFATVTEGCNGLGGRSIAWTWHVCASWCLVCVGRMCSRSVQCGYLSWASGVWNVDIYPGQTSEVMHICVSVWHILTAGGHGTCVATSSFGGCGVVVAASLAAVGVVTAFFLDAFFVVTAFVFGDVAADLVGFPLVARFRPLDMATSRCGPPYRQWY